jgi:excisionase family DNA binding protein
MNGLVVSPLQEKVLRRFLDHLAPGRTLILDNVSLPVTEELADLLRQVLEALARGEAVRVIPLEAELTTQQAAELLDVSRPHLVRLLERGVIPFHKVGAHRRVKVRDLLAYMEAARKRGEERMEGLIRESQELGLYR